MRPPSPNDDQRLYTLNDYPIEGMYKESSFPQRTHFMSSPLIQQTPNVLLEEGANES
jgi:hypothetical protein